MLNKSESLDQWATAMSAIQGELDAAIKDRTNPAFKSKYADVNAVWAVIQPLVLKHGIAVVMLPSDSGERDVLSVDYLIVHVSGQFVGNTYACPVSKSDPQGMGSALTYARRYILKQVFQVCDEDDDGNKSTLTGDDLAKKRKLIADKLTELGWKWAEIESHIQFTTLVGFEKAVAYVKSLQKKEGK